jgi:putative flippase GtrA
MTLRSLARQVLGGHEWPYQLARYLSIGTFTFCVDVGSFALMLHARWPLTLVAALSYALGTVTHFTLNKYANFRAHDRPVRNQLVTYAIVVGTCGAITIAIVDGGTLLGLPPLVAKVIAVAVNVPIGFLGHRYLTFGRGIFAALHELFARRTA